MQMLLKLGPDLQNILRQSYDNAKVTINLRRKPNLQKKSYNEWKAFHRQDSRAKS